MNYKIELWKYSQYHTAAWEEKLNREAAEGWNFKSLSMALPCMICYEKADQGKSKQYAVTRYESRESGLEYDKDTDAYIEFYRQVGWNLVYREESIFIFKADVRVRPAPAYADSEERASEERRTMRAWRFIAQAVFMFYIAWQLWFNAPMQRPVEIIMGAYFAVLGFDLMFSLVAGVMYVKGRGETALLKWLDLFETRVINFLWGLLLCTGLAFAVISAINGSIVWNWIHGEVFHRMVITICVLSVPLLLIGEYLVLVKKRRYIGYGLCLFASVGLVFNVYYGLASLTF